MNDSERSLFAKLAADYESFKLATIAALTLVIIGAIISVIKDVFIVWSGKRCSACHILLFNSSVMFN